MAKFFTLILVLTSLTAGARGTENNGANVLDFACTYSQPPEGFPKVIEIYRSLLGPLESGRIVKSYKFDDEYPLPLKVDYPAKIKIDEHDETLGYDVTAKIGETKWDGGAELIQVQVKFQEVPSDSQGGEIKFPLLKPAYGLVTRSGGYMKTKSLQYYCMHCIFDVSEKGCQNLGR